MGNRALHDPERSLEIDIKNGFNGAGGDFMQRCETVADPGIIAQNVDAAVTGKGRSEHRIDLLDIGNIHATGLCQPANVSGNLLFGTADVCDGYRGALAREQSSEEHTSETPVTTAHLACRLLLE